jgi:hypothetical protein
MLKYHEDDDIFYLDLRKDDETASLRVIAMLPGMRFEGGEVIRLIAPSQSVDNRVEVLRAERVADINGDVSTIEGRFVVPPEQGQK